MAETNNELILMTLPNFLMRLLHFSFRVLLNSLQRAINKTSLNLFQVNELLLLLRIIFE